MFDQGFGVFKIAVDGLDGIVDAGFLLSMLALVRMGRSSLEMDEQVKVRCL